jgi:hypothetical protein
MPRPSPLRSPPLHPQVVAIQAQRLKVILGLRKRLSNNDPGRISGAPPVSVNYSTFKGAHYPPK